MSTSLCRSCGERIDDSEKFCPKCGTKNFNNAEALDELAESSVEVHKAARKFVGGFHTVTLIFGLILFVVGIALLVANGGNTLLLPEAFICTLSAGVAAVFSVIGLTRKEDTLKICGISLLVSVGSLLFLLYLMM